MILLVICFTLLGYNVPRNVQQQIVPMPWGSTLADCEDVSSVILNDLARSGKVSRSGHRCVEVPMLEERAQ